MCIDPFDPFDDEAYHMYDEVTKDDDDDDDDWD